MRGNCTPLAQRKGTTGKEAVYGWYPVSDFYATTNKATYRDPAVLRPTSSVSVPSNSGHKSLRPVISRMQLFSRDASQLEYGNSRQRPTSSQCPRTYSQPSFPVRCRSATSRGVYTPNHLLQPYLDVMRASSAVSSSEWRTHAAPNSSHNAAPPVAAPRSDNVSSYGGSRTDEERGVISVPCGAWPDSHQGHRSHQQPLYSRRESEDSADPDEQAEQELPELLEMAATPRESELKPDAGVQGQATPVPDVSSSDSDRESGEEDGQPEVAIEPLLDYDAQLKKYSWRMEVHGDPLHIKEPCLPKRLSYTRKVFTKPMLKKPPSNYTMDNSTFFLNTIPIRKRTYAIHSSWASEGIHQQRMDRQRKDMANSTRDNCGKRKFPYRTTDYSFIY